MKKPISVRLLKKDPLKLNLKMTISIFVMVFSLFRMNANLPKILEITQNTISGTVADPDGTPLLGVSILVEGTTTGTQTNFDGKYTIQAATGDILVFSYVGMKSERITVGNSTTIDVTLQEDASKLDEVVITALGIKREERALGYSVTEIDGGELAKAVQVNPVNALQGKTAGVQISTTSGGTFGGSRITIRGNSTFGNNTQPIFVIDGVIMDNDLSGTNGSDWGNQLKNLNPDDFESFSILKGAAAAALYGSRALNGVVMITTKSGKKGRGLGVSVNQTVGFRTVYDSADFQNEYGSGNTAGWFSGVSNGPNTRVRDDSHDTSQFFTYDLTTGLPSVAFNSGEEHAASWGPRFDGQDIIDYDGSMAKWVAQPNNYKDSFDTGILRNTNVAIDGGSEMNSFRLSLSNFSESGVSPRNDFDKNSISFKGSQDLIQDQLTVGATVHYTRSSAKNPVNPGANSDWFHDGFPRNYDVNKWKNNYKDVDGGIPYPAGGSYNYTRMSRLWMGILDDEDERVEGSLIGKINLNYNISDNISAVLEGNINQYTWTGEYKTYAKDANRLGGAYGISNGEKFQHSISGKLFFNKELNDDIRMDLILGGEMWSTETKSSSVSTNGGFKIRDFFSISNSLNAANANGGIGARKKINSAYAFFNTSYKKDLYLNLTARNDWSSALVYPDGHGNSSYFYPSGSLAWVSSETFQLPEVISFAKLRASYAIVGNDTDPYKLSTGYVADNFGSNPDLNLFRYENGTAISPDLQPEKKYSFEAGIDLRLFENKVGLDVAYYKDNTKNQIIALPVPNESGISSQLINAGNLQNSGVEVALDINIIDNDDFSWDVGFNFTKNRDKIIELAPGINEFRLFGNPDDSNAGTASYAYVGGNYGDLVTRRGYTYYDGANTENHDKRILANRNGWSVAYPIGINNKDSLHVMGNMQPDWYGGANTSFRYKRFRFNAIVDARYGGEIYSADARYGLHQGVIKSSLPNRDASQGGITWTSEGQGQNFFGKTYYDGYIPDGVFPDGTTVTSGPADNRTNVDVSGMTYQQAYDQGLVEPTHWSGYVYRWTSASTGSPITGVYTQSWIGLREVSMSYEIPQSILNKIAIKSATISLTGRDLGFLYNSMPDNINPSISSNAAANPLQMRSAPYIRSITFAVNLNF
tara:strand:- start:1922 stop:5383 length:3462 start_codon:yes stop_codon:yes gene_type:complete